MKQVKIHKDDNLVEYLMQLSKENVNFYVSTVDGTIVVDIEERNL